MPRCLRPAPLRAALGAGLAPGLSALTAPVLLLLLAQAVAPAEASRLAIEYGDADHGDTSSVPSSSVAVLMLGGISFSMALKYLVHWPDPGVRLMTWKLMSSTTSIFIAVMLNATILRFMWRHVNPVLGGKLASVLGLGLLWVALHVLVFVNRRKLGRVACAIIGEHLLGLSCIYVFGHLQEFAHFRGNFWTAAMVIPIYVAVAVGCSIASYAARVAIKDCSAALETEDADDAEDQAPTHASSRWSRLPSMGATARDREEHWEHWDEQCRECEDDAACMCLGFLIQQLARFAICGALPPLEDSSVPHTLVQDHLLFASGVFFLAVLFISAVALPDHLRPWAQRAARIFRGTLGGAMAWCWISWGEWHLEDTVRMDRLLAEVCLANMTSGAGLVLILVLDCLAERGALNPTALREVIKALGLLIGFSWEKTFDAVLDDLRTAHWTYLIALGLSIFMLPGWRLYILSKATQAWTYEQHMCPPSVASLCMEDMSGSEEGLEDGEEDGYDSEAKSE